MALLSIDFGTSYCAAAWLSSVSGKPEAIAFCEDEYNNAHYKFPSAIVYIKDKVGNETKRVGERAHEIIIAGKDVKNSCYKIKTDLAPERFREINGRKKPLAEIVGDLFAEIKEKATQTALQQNGYFDEVVITHPAEFEYKELLYDAADIAGWQKEKVKLLEEPIAAVYGFSMNQPIPNNSGVVVFDYGGGTIDVAYLFKLSDGEFKWTFPPKGESRCGGEYIDISLHNHFKKEAHMIDNGMIDFDLLNQCRKAKVAFSNPANPGEEIFINDTAYKLSRHKFEGIISSQVERAIEVFKNVIRECKSHDKPIDYILLNGGSSKLSLVRKRIIAEGFPEDRLIMFKGEDIAVALGGIIYYNGHNIIPLATANLEENEIIEETTHKPQIIWEYNN